MLGVDGGQGGHLIEPLLFESRTQIEQLGARCGVFPLGAEGLELNVLIELENPNQEPLPLDSLQYHVSINGSSVFRGRRSPESTLGARSRRTIALPVPVLYSRTGWDPAAPPRSFDVSISGTLLYVTPGRIAELLLDTGVHRPTVGFSGSIQVE